MSTYHENLSALQELANQAKDPEAKATVAEWLDEHSAKRVGEQVVPKLVALPDGTVDYKHNARQAQNPSGARGDQNER